MSRRTIKRAAAPREYIPPRTNWQDVGRDLQKQYIARATAVPSKADHSTTRGGHASFLSNIIALAQHGHPVPLFEFLRSGHELTQFNREQLADMVLVSFTPSPAKRGRPKRFEVRRCAAVARRFYLEWRDTNRRNDINDWGHRDAMKDESCRVAIELYYLFPGRLKDDAPITVEEIREHMERPAARRK